LPIDNEFDAVHSQYDVQPANRVFELLLQAGDKVGLPLGPLQAIRDHFSGAAVKERVEALLVELERAVRRHDKTFESLVAELNSSGFRETLLTATAETARIENYKKIERFAQVLGHELATPDLGVPAWDDAGAFIRELAQLGEPDIEALRLLYRNQSALSAGFGRVPLDPNAYTRLLKPLLDNVDSAGIDRDDFYSRCARLTGFGLILEVQRSDTRQSPTDHCFRLTARGRKLIQIIDNLPRF
jgi:hypothetical protein